MADPTTGEEEQAPETKYMVLQRKSADELQRRVNKYINAQVDAQKYIPYGPMMIVDGTFYQVMVVASLATQKVSVTGGLGNVGPISGSITVSE